MSPSYHVSVQVEMTVSAPDHEAAEERCQGMVERALCQAAGVLDCVDDVRAGGAQEAIL